MKKELFVITYIEDYPFSGYEKVWAYDKDEALELFEAKVGVLKECVKCVETHDEWLEFDC